MSANWLIWSNEHRAWWGWNGNGYVRSMDKAGRYSFEEANQICKSANCWIGRDGVPQETMVPVESLPEPMKET